MVQATNLIGSWNLILVVNTAASRPKNRPNIQKAALVFGRWFSQILTLTGRYSPLRGLTSSSWGGL